MPTRVSKRQAAKGPVKVKSSTIGAIKKTGMSKALGNITPAQRKNAAYMTGLKRMYGAARVNKALAPKNMSVPVGGVMGTKRAQVMAGPVRSTMKKTAAKKGDGVSSEELVQIQYKCNFDLTFVKEVAEKIDFKIDDYLITGNEG
jgi:hypothetical protein